MTRARSPDRHTAWIRRAAGAALAVAAAGSTAADIPFERAWYQVELVVFERAAPAEATEELTRDEPRLFPRSACAFDDGAGRTRFYPFADLGGETPLDLAQLAELGVDVRAAGRPGVRHAAPGTAGAPAATSPPVPPSPREALLEATQRFEETLVAEHNVWLPVAALRLGAERRRLEAQGGYRVLLHGAWIQAVPPREQPTPNLVQAGDVTDGLFELEGIVEVTVARYLHLNAVLWRNVAPAADGPEPLPRYLVLREQRRMRSGEVHYLDHPRLGVLARIDPVEPPESLRALAEAL